MGEGRGKKAKKAKWQVQLGVRDLVFAGLGIAGLVMLSFALGTMAGRGDIYRLLCNWGLLTQDSGKVFQTWQPAPPPPPASATGVNAATPASPPGTPPEKPGTGTTATPEPPAPPAPVKGHLVAAPQSGQAPAKTPSSPAAKEQKVEKIRQEVANKLKFQNSLDLTATRAAAVGKGKKADDKEASKTSVSQVLVAKFRDPGQAKAKLAQMQKQGDKVFLKEGKDIEGVYYALYRLVPAGAAKPNQVAQKQEAPKAKPTSPPAKNPPH